ncbi:MAG: prolyl oligopeptidase family serine peptidase [Candidatus Heimdallarchaeota archaeon]
MIKNKQKLPYKQWKPSVTPENVFSDIVTLGEIKIVGRTIYWLEQRPAEQGRVVLVKCDELGQISDVTPKGYWIRTRVHEYGGGAYTLNDQYVYFVNFTDQRIYRQSLTEKQFPQPLTPEKNSDGSLGKYGALELSSDGTQLVFVYEKEYTDTENENFIAALDLLSEELREPAILASGNDFYADPKISSDGKTIVWLTWNHPKMPWDYTELIVAEFDGNHLVPGSEQEIAGRKNASVCLPKFDQHGNLYYVMDEAGHEEKSFKNWWNLYCYKKGNTEVITKELAEFGMPLWGLGQSGYSFLSNGNLICRTITRGKANLVVVDPKKKECMLLDLPFTEYDSLQIDENDDLVFVGANPLTPPAVTKLNCESMEITIIKPSTTRKISEEDLSIPKFISYPTSDGKMAYGYLYLPKNCKYEAPVDDKPPLIVIVHGGPTSRTSSALNLRKGIQFWTSQGYAVLDVEYRGSTGYGRNYRDALFGEWGVIDASDIKDGVNYLLKEELVSKKIIIRGGSAGGYAVQRALTLFPELFSAGASYYGIGNLLTLVEEIHKFESRYLDFLLGTSLAEGLAIYQERSPINHLDKLRAPMILFQGSEDKIVTPEVSQEMARALEKRGIEYEYHEYEGETHGFRRKETNVDALIREAQFYRKILYRTPKL